MNVKKLICTSLSAVLIAAAFSGCSAAKEPDAPPIYSPSYDYVKPLGRTAIADDGSLWLVHSGTGAEFTFNGTKASITMEGDSNASPSAEGNLARIAIYVNGERVVDDTIDAAEKTYTVFESQEAAECDVKIVKLSEAGNSTCGIKSIEVTSEEPIRPAEKKERFIEFIGDSITCGYGVDDEYRDHHFSTATEDVTKTYAYKTAEKLNADYSMVSMSGHGIISGYTTGAKVPTQVIPKLYSKLGSSGGMYNGKSAITMAWDFTGYTPDAIVINLGTNDSSYVKRNEEKTEEFRAAYVEFLKKIRSSNPDAVIFCTLGIMGNDLYPAIEHAVSDYTGETGDTKVTAMMFDVQDQNDGIAADWHPSEKTHEKAAEKLSAYISEYMGW